jgi:hypothetical protein
MNDAQRYRMNAAECLSAVERCGPPYRGLTLALSLMTNDGEVDHPRAG